MCDELHVLGLVETRAVDRLHQGHPRQHSVLHRAFLVEDLGIVLVYRLLLEGDLDQVAQIHLLIRRHLQMRPQPLTTMRGEDAARLVLGQAHVAQVGLAIVRILLA